MTDTDSTSNAADTEVAQAQQAVGLLLCETRKQAGLDIAEVARVLRISKRYLEAMEEGRIEDLPGTAYAIGFARSYAEHLKLDGEEIVRRYKAEALGVSAKTDLTFPKPIPDSGVPGAAVLGLGVILAGVAYGVWYWNSNGDELMGARVDPVPEHMAAPAEEKAVVAVPELTPEPAPEPVSEPEVVVEPAIEPTVAAITEDPATEAQEVESTPETMMEAVQETTEAPEMPVEVPVEAAPVETPAEDPTETIPVDEQPVVEAPDVETPVVETPAVETPAVEPTVTEAPEPTPAEPTPPVENGDSRITVRAKSNSWIQIRDEALDRLLFTRLLRQGDTYEVPNRAGLRLMTGNAGALELLVDGKPIAAIGAVGEVRRNVELDPEKLKSGTAVSE